MATDTASYPTTTNQSNTNMTTNRDQEALSTIKKYTLIAAGGGLLSNSALSFAVNTGVQTLMIKELCTIYDVNFDSRIVNVLAQSALGSAITSGLSLAFTSITPGGNFAGLNISGAGIASIYTAAIGEYYKTHFEEGGTLENVSLNDIGHQLLDEIQNGDHSVTKMGNPNYLVKSILNMN